MVTYAEALAACVARWGAPRHESTARGITSALWPRTPGLSVDVGGGIELRDDAGEVMLLASDGWRSTARPGMWALASDDDAIAPLPDALDLAAAWLDGRTKGP